MGLKCPECGAEVTQTGYRMMFVECSECGEVFHVDQLKGES